MVQCKVPANPGTVGSIPGLGRSPREGNGNPLQYSRLEKPMDRGAWQGVKKESDTTEHLNNNKILFTKELLEFFFSFNEHVPFF